VPWLLLPRCENRICGHAFAKYDQPNDIGRIHEERLVEEQSHGSKSIEQRQRSNPVSSTSISRDLTSGKSARVR